MNTYLKVDALPIQKTETKRPVFKKEGRTKIKENNVLIFLILKNFLILFPKFMKDLFTVILQYVEAFLLNFISAYRESYSSHYVHMRLIESWKRSLGQNKFVGAVEFNGLMQTLRLYTLRSAKSQNALILLLP